MTFTYDNDYDWGQGKKDELQDLLNWARDMAPNIARSIFDRFLWGGLYGFVRVGVCLKNVAIAKLFKPKYRTFKNFCQKYLNISPGLAKRYIEASDTWLTLANAVDYENEDKWEDKNNPLPRFTTLPQNISQTIPLTKLNQHEDMNGDCELFEKWEQILDYTEKVNQGKLTSTAVREIVDGKPAPKQIAVDSDFWELINEQSAKEGLSKKDFLKKVLDNYLNPPNREFNNPEDIKVWRDDLEDMIREYDQKNDEVEKNEPSPTPTPEPEPKPLPQEEKLPKIVFGKLTPRVLTKEITATVRENYQGKEGARLAVFEKPRSKKQLGEIEITKTTEKRINQLTSEDLDKMGFFGFTPKQYKDYCWPELTLRTKVYLVEFQLQK